MEFVRVTFIPAGFFVGLAFVILIIVAVINGELGTAFELLIQFIERYKLIISIILGILFGVFGAFLSGGENGKATALSAAALVLNGPVLKEAIVWIVDLLSSVVSTDSDPFSNAIMFLLMLVPIIFTALVMCVLLALFFGLTTLLPVAIIDSCVENDSKVLLAIYLVIHFVVMGVLAIGMY